MDALPQENRAPTIVERPKHEVRRVVFGLDTHLATYADAARKALCGARPPREKQPKLGGEGKVCMACRIEASRMNARVV